MDRKREQGQGLVEFALVLPLLLLIVFGIVEFGILLYDKAVLTNACREGARAGIVSQNPRVTQAQIQTVVQNYCTTNLVTFGAGAAPTVTATVNPSASFGDPLTVTATYSYEFLVLPNFTHSGNSQLVLSSSSVMRYE